MNRRFSLCLRAGGLSFALVAGSVLVMASAPPNSAAGSTAHPTQALPAALRPVLYRALAKDAGAASRFNKDGCAVLPRQSLKACFDASGAHFTGTTPASPAGRPLSLRLVAWGRNGHFIPADSVRPKINGNQASYAHGNLSAWWRVLPIGFEQGFTIAKRPAGHSELTLALAATSQAEQHNGSLTWGRLRYGGLVVTDAKGKLVPAMLKSAGDRVLIAVNDAHTTYPLTVDPLLWTGWVGQQLAQAVESPGGAGFGSAVAASGNIVFVGANDAYINGIEWVGAAYVFTESNGGWTRTAELTASDGAEDDHFGDAVALDGTTAVVGVPDHATNGNFRQGAAYVFTESNGTWSQAAELSASDGAASDQFGTSVAVSGATILVGAPDATIGSNGNEGTAYVFTHSNGTWSQAAKLTASDGYSSNNFGWSVALAGSTALVGSVYGPSGGSYDSSGAAYVFTGSGNNWTQTAKLVGNDTPYTNERLGYSVALAPSGTTALVGAPYLSTHGNSNQGAAYVFAPSGETWSQAAELTPSDGATGDNFGWSVAVSGATALIGAPMHGYHAQGAGYLFTDSGGNWTQTQELTESWGTTSPCGEAGSEFGSSVSLLGGNPVAGQPGAWANCDLDGGVAYVYGQGALGFAVSAPATVGQGQIYVSQATATNNASAASPAVTATVLIPAAASFIAATPSQGSCSEPNVVPTNRTTVVCNFGQIAGNAGTATANITLKATAPAGTTIANTASVAFAHPPLTASAPTAITEGSCPAGYAEYDGTLAVDVGARVARYEAPAGEENAILYAPAGFKLYGRVDFGNDQRWERSFSGTEVHRWGPAGIYSWGVKAGGTDGAYTFCLNHP